MGIDSENVSREMKFSVANGDSDKINLPFSADHEQSRTIHGG